MTKHQWRVSGKQAGMSLLQFLKEMCKDAPSIKMLKRAIEGKCCTVNKQIPTFSSHPLKKNDLVTLNPQAFETQVAPLSSILYEDATLLIINKPAGVVSDEKSIQASLPSHRGRLLLVHRLDKETSGVLILAKTSPIKEKLLTLFKERLIHKLYLAIVDGVVEKGEGCIDNYLGKKSGYEGQTVYGSVSKEKGLRALTQWKCLQRGEKASLLSCEPHTGRTHQLRVHLSGIGHPILGDSQYAKRFCSSYTPLRNLLHAYRVTFKHPLTEQPM